MKRALTPPDVWTARRLVLFQILGWAGIVYSTVCRLVGVALFFASLLTVICAQEAKRLWLRLEQLEADVMLRDLGSGAHKVQLAEKPAEPSL
jgi:hypothetical protein